MRAGVVALAGLSVLLAEPAAAQRRPPVPRAEPVVLEVEERSLAETLAAVWTATDLHVHAIEPAEGGFRVLPALPGAARVVPTDGVHHALRRLFGGEDQAVVELRPRAASDGSVRVGVDVDADAAVLVVTGEDADTVRSFPAPVPWVVESTNGPRHAVRHLGRRRAGEPLSVSVPAGARVSLVTRREPVRLHLLRGAGRVRVSGVPDDDRYELVVTLDTERLEVEREAARQRTAELPADLAGGRHVLEARLHLRATGARVAGVRQRFWAPAADPVTLRAGAGPTCVTLTGDAVAHPPTLRRLATERRPIALRYEPGAVRDDGMLAAGTRVCVSTPFFMGDRQRTFELSRSGRHTRAHLRVDVVPLPAPLRVGVPALAFALFLGWLARVGWPKRPPPPTHLAWTRQPAASYRDVEARRWEVVPLPARATALGELDPDLSGATHRVEARADAARLVAAHPVVVAPAADAPATLQLGELTLPAGAQVVDGPLHLAVLDERGAARLRAGHRLSTPSAAAIAEAHDRGPIDPPTDPRPSRARRGAGILLAALLATAAPYLPWLIGATLAPSIEPWTGTTAVWLGGYGASALAVLASVRAAKRRAARGI